MSDFTTVLSLILGFLGGGGALVTYMLYRKQLKRFKNAEAVEKEVATLRSAIAAMEQNQNGTRNGWDRCKNCCWKRRVTLRYYRKIRTFWKLSTPKTKVLSTRRMNVAFVTIHRSVRY